MDANKILSAQKAYFREGNTLSVKSRKAALKKLLSALEQYEEKICTALYQDLGKSPSESYMCELSQVKSEIRYMLKNLSRLSRERRVPTPLAQYVSRSFVLPSPYGTVLIVSPWNYPILLSLSPLVDALAAGNTVILKPSAYSPQTSLVIKELMEHCFPEELVSVVTGGREENEALFSLDVQYIFFTGSSRVGKEVLRYAAERIIPVTLELGGKSPCIVDETANIPLAARRIVFGKFVNCGQTCVAPDYILCHSSVKEKLIEALKKELILQYGEQPLSNPNYGKIINEKHYHRLLKLMEFGDVLYGGEAKENRIAPCLLSNLSWDAPIMQEEIFGPLLPILSYEDTDAGILAVQNRPEPLALYIFSSNNETIRKWKQSVSFGGGCINDTLIHLATHAMGFGGVGQSGMGSYHGKRGFETFSHFKSIVDKKTFLDLPMRYQPYTGWKDFLVRTFVR